MASWPGSRQARLSASPQAKPAERMRSWCGACHILPCRQADTYTNHFRTRGTKSGSSGIQHPAEAKAAHSAQAFARAVLTAFDSAGGKVRSRFSNRAEGNEPMACTLATDSGSRKGRWPSAGRRLPD